MRKYTCVEKIRKENGTITAYVLKNERGELETYSPEVVKEAMILENIQIDNLQLTSDGRLIDKRKEDANLEVSRASIKPSLYRNNELLKEIIEADTHLKVSYIEDYVDPQCNRWQMVYIDVKDNKLESISKMSKAMYADDKDTLKAYMVAEYRGLAKGFSNTKYINCKLSKCCNKNTKYLIIGILIDLVNDNVKRNYLLDCTVKIYEQAIGCSPVQCSKAKDIEEYINHKLDSIEDKLVAVNAETIGGYFTNKKIEVLYKAIARLLSKFTLGPISKIGKNKIDMGELDNIGKDDLNKLRNAAR